MKKEVIQLNNDTLTLAVYESSVGGGGNSRQRDQWELNISNQYDNTLLQISYDAELANFLKQRTGQHPSDLLMDFAKSKLGELKKKSRSV